MSGFWMACGHRYEGDQSGDLRKPDNASCAICREYTTDGKPIGGVLCLDKDGVTVTVNWEELSFLCEWAELHEHELHPARDKSLVQAIAERIMEQCPEKGLLTMRSWIKKCKEGNYTAFELPDGSGDVFVRPEGEIARRIPKGFAVMTGLVLTPCPSL